MRYVIAGLSFTIPDEAPCTELHAGWCGREGIETPSYPSYVFRTAFQLGLPNLINANTVPTATETAGTRADAMKLDIKLNLSALNPSLIDQSTSSNKLNPSMRCIFLSCSIPIPNKTGLNTALIHTILIPLVRKNDARLFILLFNYYT